VDYIKACRISAISAAIFLASLSALAQDTPESRSAAAQRYLSVVPTAKIMDDTINEMAKMASYDKQPHVIEWMKKVYRADFVEKASLEAMVKIFTTDELNAMADYYGSKDGASAMLKFGAYMAQVLPTIQGEVRRAIDEFKKSELKK
jgi:hypothetical protein